MLKDEEYNGFWSNKLYRSVYLHVVKRARYNIIAVGRRKTDNGFFQSYNIPYYLFHRYQK